MKKFPVSQSSLRDLITTLDAGRKKLQQVGLGAVSRSTLADANRKRPQEIFGELFCGSSGKWGGGDVVGTFRIPNLLPVRLSI